MVTNASRNVLNELLAESNATAPVKTDPVSARAYRRIAIEKHRTWVAVVSTGATFLLAVPTIAESVSVYGSLLTHWIGQSLAL